MDLRTQNAALARENGLLKYAALHGSRPKHVKPKAEAADPVSEEVGSLQRQLKAARTRIKNLVNEAARVRQHAAGFGKVLSKAERRAVLAALHPNNASSKTTKRRMEEAFKIVNRLRAFDARKTRPAAD